jgi:hypothetical protein
MKASQGKGEAAVVFHIKMIYNHKDSTRFALTIKSTKIK